jgi:prepilin-type processing-associated H-X9-DG protein
MVSGLLRRKKMKSKAIMTRKDVLIALGCAVFLVASLGAVGSTGRWRAKEAVCLSNLLKWGVIWKSYADDHDGYFPDRSAMVDWPFTIRPYCGYPALWLCPEATKPYSEGGRPPFASWDYEIDGVRTYCSYTLNLWVANSDYSRFWRTPNVAGAASVPLMSDGNWKDAEPFPNDEAPPYDGYWWEPNRNEMKRVCINRHRGAVNMVFLDLSARKIGLKELWKLKWHREWPAEGGFPSSGWPPWMENFKDY